MQQKSRSVLGLCGSTVVYPVPLVPKARARREQETCRWRGRTKCPERDSNPQGLLHQILSLARLPIPPSGRGNHPLLSCSRTRKVANLLQYYVCKHQQIAHQIDRRCRRRLPVLQLLRYLGRGNGLVEQMAAGERGNIPSKRSNDLITVIALGRKTRWESFSLSFFCMSCRSTKE
jgi:hypothetical protein